MKRTLLTLLLIALTSLTASAQIFYRITGKGLEKPSYIFGTYHFASEDFVKEVEGLADVFEGVDIVCGEVETSNFNSMTAAEQLLEQVKLPEGITYEDLLSAEDYAKLNAVLKKRIGADLTNPYVAQNIGCYVPQMLSLMLQMLEPVKIEQGGYINMNKPVDAYFQRVALERGKEVMWLEDLQFQMDILFGSSLEEQASELAWYLNNREVSVESAKQLVNAYLTQDIEAINEVFGEEMCSGRYDDDWVKRLVDNRNKHWVKVMPEIMEKGSTLFVVGVGHLDYGKKSVIRLLRKKGYKVEAVGR